MGRVVTVEELSDRAEKLFRDIAAGEITAVPREPWKTAIGPTAFDLSDGSVLEVYKRSDRWKYTEYVIFPDGIKLEYGYEPNETEPGNYTTEDIDDRLSEEDHTELCRNLGMPVDEWKAEDEADAKHMRECGLDPENNFHRAEYYMARTLHQARAWGNLIKEKFGDRKPEDVSIREVVEAIHPPETDD